MVSKWTQVRLDSVAVLRNGAGIKQDFFSESGIPLARVSDFTQDSIDLSACKKVESSHAACWKSHVLKEGNVVVATVGSWPPNWTSVVGKVVRVPFGASGALQNQNTCCVLPLSDFLNQEFLFYRLKLEDFALYAANNAGGSANQARLPIKKLGEFQFLLPSLVEQRLISSVLSALDRKVDLNRQINQTLEQMAQAIFQSWFVDFDPVKAKISARENWLTRQADQAQPHADAPPFEAAASAAQPFAQVSNQASNQAAKKASNETAADAAQSPAAQFPAVLSPAEQADLEIFINRAAMCAISGKTDADLDAMPAADYQRLYHTASLFPDELIESELGEIPKGWAIGAIGDMLEFNPKRSLKKGSLAPYLDMKNVPTSGHLADEVVFREMGSGSKFINGDTLLARITPCLENGKTAFVDFLNDDEVGWGSTEFIVIRPKDGYPYSLGYLLARDSNFRQVAIQSMTGTSGRQRADAKALAEKNWVVYPKALMMEFGAFSESYLQLAKRNGDQISTLTHLRNSLLPKLLSGELDISALTDLADHAAEPGATHV
ncbi:restriction endonuclease subunit S [Thalassolituus alkanivorans]|uniref:restriction endonuclease subunit S n=1 Tax=Thalassolituus alkanivorans TaxID=2881055 RepID=UPI001E48BBC1|nr:restriction endonuclease subunit S [Thalassolituus alkanivorans]MCB2385865.1 restriction endonuclease subunit S [Thalassolituus alkanivorans]MCB2421715.1 restriction endonuclease subunit S [Thalassolituus alkanivorans]